MVADGMGGANAGEVAAETAIRYMQDVFLSEAKNVLGGEEERKMRYWFENAHQEILQLSFSKAEFRGMGSTLVAIWLKNDKAHIVWCGDSRCYLYRNSLRLLTEDHSLVNDYVRRGLISLEASRKHPSKHVLTQVLGDESNQIRPDSLTIDLVDKDMFMLCSDGLNNMLPDDKIAKIIEKGDNICQNLFSDALNAGGSDNISIIIVEVKKKA